MLEDLDSEECKDCKDRGECKERNENFSRGDADLKASLIDMRRWFEDRPGLGDKVLEEAKRNLCMLLTKAVGSNPLLTMAVTLDDDNGILQAAELALLMGYKRGYEDKNLESMLADTQQK